jgi:GTPase involved in cell partitioning and DNA repair
MHVILISLHTPGFPQASPAQITLVVLLRSMKSLAGVQQLYKAESGSHGSKQKQHGRAGRDTTVLVPVGTVVSRLAPTAEPGAESPDLALDPGAQRDTHASSGSSSSSSSSREGAGSLPTASALPGSSRGQPRQSHPPRQHLLHRKRQRGDVEGASGLAGPSSGGRESGDAGEDLRPAAEDEIPDWLKRWRQPWVGARDYRTDEEEEDPFGDEDQGEGAGSNSSSSLSRAQAGAGGYEVLADLVEDGQEVRGLFEDPVCCLLLSSTCSWEELGPGEGGTSLPSLLGRCVPCVHMSGKHAGLVFLGSQESLLGDV